MTDISDKGYLEGETDNIENDAVMDDLFVDVEKITVPLKSRFFALVTLTIIGLFFLHKFFVVSKYGVTLGPVKMSRETVKYILAAISGGFLLYALKIFLEVKMTSYLIDPIKLNLIFKNGVVTTEENKMDCVDYRDHFIKRGSLDRILGLSTMTIISTDNTHPTQVIKGLKKDDIVKIDEFLNIFGAQNYVDHRMKKEAMRKYKERTANINKK